MDRILVNEPERELGLAPRTDVDVPSIGLTSVLSGEGDRPTPSCAQDEAPSAEPEIEHADFAPRQRQWAQETGAEARVDFWQAALAGAPDRLELPTDHPRPARQDFGAALLALALDRDLLGGLEALGRRQGTPLHPPLLAGWAAPLPRPSGQKHLVLGLPSAGPFPTGI